MLPKALQLPGNWHFKPSAAKTCSHNMFMKCQMLQNAVVTALCTRYTSFLTLSQYCFFHTFTFSYHMFFLTFSVSFPSPNPYNPSGELSMSCFSKAAFIQPPPPYKPVRLHPFLPLFIPIFLTHQLSEFNISSLTLLLFPFLSAPSVLAILPASQASQGAQNLTSQQVLQGDS